MNNNSNSIILSSLEKVFPNEKLPTNEYKKFSMMKNEKSSFELAFIAKKGVQFKIQIESELKDYIHINYVEMIPSKIAVLKDSDDFILPNAKNNMEYPDLLVPIKNDTFTAKYDGVNTLWFEIKDDNELPVGLFDINIKLLQNNEVAFENSIKTEVINANLEKQDFIFTNWFHSDCLMSYYGFDAFSDEYWRVVKNFLKRANEYGMNCVLTPLFTPALDTAIGKERPTVQLVGVKVIKRNQYEFNFDKVKKWIQMCNSVGIEYFEMSHFFTQWGAKHAPKIVADVKGKEKKIFGWKTRANGRKYKTFINQFAIAFTKFVDENGIRDKVFLHISDEPSNGNIKNYKKASKIVHDNFKNFKIIDALSDIEIYDKGLIENPIPANDKVQDFIGKVPELWTYYCCSQRNNNVSNRFFSMPSQRNRVLGTQLYKFNVKGFLHWGFNFYYLQFSKGLIDPYKVTDAGGSFPSGDSFVVYPNSDGTPLNSLRLNVFYDAFQDKMALELLQSKIGREKTLELLESNLKSPLTFSEYPHDKEWILDLREKVNMTIKENL